MAVSKFRNGVDPELLEVATERQKEYVKAVIRTGSCAKAAKALDCHPSLITNAMRALTMKVAARKPQPQAPGLTFPVFPSGDIPTEHILDHLERQYMQDAKASAARKWFKIEAHENLPIAINWFGDPHLGSPGCNITLLRRDVDLVAKTPGMYGGNIGDTVDNWGGRLIRLYAESDVSKKTERQLARWFLQDSGINWAIWLHGNHDSMSSEFKLYMDGLGAEQVPMIDWRAQFKIGFPNGQEVRIDAAHDHKGHSMWNDLHGQERASVMEEAADIYIAGHRHNWAFKVKETVDGRVVNLVRCRGYKFLDDYAVRWQFPQQQQGASMVTLLDPCTDSPTERVRVFADTKAAADYLTYLRAKYAGKRKAA